MKKSVVEGCIQSLQNGISIRGIMTTSAEQFGDCSSHEELTINTSRGISSLVPSRLGLKFIVAQVIPLKDLRVLELQENEWSVGNYLQELWLDECDVPLQLRELVLFECFGFKGFPKSIGHLKQLKKKVVDGMLWIKSRPEEFCLLQSLEHLGFKKCYRLSSLSNIMGNLRNLRHLNLFKCDELGRLPDSCKELRLLQYLRINNSSNVTFKSDIIENMPRLEFLDFSRCSKVEELPLHITNQASLRELYLERMWNLREAPMKIDQLSKLQKLSVGGNSLTSFLASFEDLSSLTTLEIAPSRRLECFVDTVGHLGVKPLPKSISQFINLENLSIDGRPVRKLNLGAGPFGSLCKLKRLKLKDSVNLTEIEGLPSSVRILAITRCPKLSALPSLAQLTSLQEFKLISCFQLKKIEDNCRELEKLKADTRWEVPYIESLECMERLRVLHFTAMKKSVVEGCIQSLQNGISIRGIMTTSTEQFGDCSSHEELTINTSRGISSLVPSRLGLKFIVAQVIPLKDLRVLELQENEWSVGNYLQELWLDECDAPLQLRELVLFECFGFKGFPKSIGHLKQLKKIVVDGMLWIKSLPEEFCLLQSLEHLEFKKCYRLSSLSNIMGNLRNLRHLNLFKCDELGRLPDSCKELRLLQYLRINNSSNVTFKSDIIENMPRLEFLDFSRCSKVEELPLHITNQASLRELYLERMWNLREAPMKIDQLSKLQKLSVGGNSLTSFLASFEDLSSLTTLEIAPSRRLECFVDTVGHLGVKPLPKSISQFINLENLSIDGRPVSKLNLGAGPFGSLCKLKRLKLKDSVNLTEIEGLPSSVRILVITRCPKLSALPSLAQLTSLQEFKLISCFQLKKIEDNCRELEKLKADTRWEVPYIESLECMERLRVLHFTTMKKSVVEGCSQSLQNGISIRGIMTTSAEQFGDCSLHEELTINTSRGISSLVPSRLGLKFIVAQGFKGFPKSIGHLKQLKKIVLDGMLWMESLSEEFCLLQSLEHLEFKRCYRLSSLPNSMGNLRNLRHLNFFRCDELGRLPDSCKELRLLQYLSINNSSNVTFKSDIMENMSRLEFLDFSRCSKVEELPRHITNQASLRELYLERMWNLRDVPMKIDQLSKLQKLSVGGNSLTSFLASFEDLSSLTRLEIAPSRRLECLVDTVGHLGVKPLPKSISQFINLESLSIDRCPVSKLNLGAGPFGSLCKLQRLKLKDSVNLTEIEDLPSSVRILVITRCPKLSTLPSLAQLASLQEFKLISCFQLKKIEGLHHCRELEKLKADTRWEVPCIESLECMERLRMLHLTSRKKSVVEGCIQSLQDTNGNAILVCYVTRTQFKEKPFHVWIRDSDDCRFYMEVERGTWIWIGVFTQRSKWYTPKGYSAATSGKEHSVKKSLFAMGEEDRVMTVYWG
ncbi:hypothetical protein SUGI_0537090 [Cryptomeria japonica]|nr:hypothetical protein SUGI_0537090 [Cryptomeria japonica]